MSDKEIIVEGGGFRFLTKDPFLIAAVRKCAELERRVRDLRLDEVGRYRTLRRDVSRMQKDIAELRRSQSPGIPGRRES